MKTGLIWLSKYLLYPVYLIYSFLFLIIGYLLSDEAGDYYIFAIENSIALVLLYFYIRIASKHVSVSFLIVLFFLESLLLLLSAQGVVSNSLVSIQGGTNESAAKYILWSLIIQLIKIGIVTFGIAQNKKADKERADEV